jgi:hypothetical protein
MLGDHPYYMLMAGLPALRRFDGVQHLARLAALPPRDAMWVRTLWDFLSRDAGVHGDDAALLGHYDATRAAGVPPALAAIVEHRLWLATAIAALRRRGAGRHPPARSERWGVEPLASRIARAWDKSDFGLGTTHSWLPEVRDLLQARDFTKLELQQQRLFWRYLDGVAQGHNFDLTALIVYVCRWQITDQWLRRSSESAGQRFRGLVSQVLGIHDTLFA